MSSSRRRAPSGTDQLAAGRPSVLLPAAAALSPLRRSSRSDSDPQPAPAASRGIWPSSSDSKIISSSNKSPSVATLADHLTNDAMAPPQSLSRQRSCTELPRFADERKIGRSSGHAFGRSMRFLPSSNSKPAANVTLTPGRMVAPSALRSLASGSSSGSECSDASRPAIPPKPQSPLPLIARASSVRHLLGSSTTQWALSPGRRSGCGSPVATATVPTESSKGKKSLLSMGWGRHLFNRRKTTDDAPDSASIATTTTTTTNLQQLANLSAGHQMRIMHCRLLQCRLVNAKAEAASRSRRDGAEVQLMGTWAKMSELRGKVARKRVQLVKENLNIKLTHILSSQLMRDLDSWGQLDSDHALALGSTLDCAKAAVCRIPLTNGAKVSLPAMSSILDQMFELAIAVRISVRSFSPMAQDTAVLVSELLRVARQEQGLLHECLELLGRVSALHIEEQSLRCHMVQSSSLLNLVTVN